MAQVILEGSQDTAAAKKMQQSLEQGHNRPTTDGAWVARPEEYRLYIFTVAQRAFVVNHALLGTFDIPAVEPGQRVRKVRFVPHPFPQKVEDVFALGREPYDYHDGRRVAQDICNPANPTLDQSIDDYGKLDPFFAVQDGTNLARFGVFWSMNAEATDKEIELAEKKRDSYYRHLIREHDQLFAAKPANAANFGPDIRMALDYFGEERSYHKKFVPVQMCGNCGMQIPMSAGFHFMPNGVACILDWQKAVGAGVKTLADVPEDKRWIKSPKQA